MTTSQLPAALTIAGFDPSGGAGVIADIRTFTDFGLTGAAAITSITFQNEQEFLGAVHQPAAVVRSQVNALLKGATMVAAKTGMLPTREIVLEVAALFRELNLPPPVVDPVIVSSSGHRLMEDDALAALIEHLMPLAKLVTPNVPEAEKLTGMKIETESDLRQAAADIRKMGARAVLVKGGHLTREDDAIDVLDDQGSVTVFSERRIANATMHGSGCILSAAIAAGLGKGMNLGEAVRGAKSFVLEAIRKTVESER